MLISGAWVWLKCQGGCAIAVPHMQPPGMPPRAAAAALPLLLPPEVVGAAAAAAAAAVGAVPVPPLLAGGCVRPVVRSAVLQGPALDQHALPAATGPHERLE